MRRAALLAAWLLVLPLEARAQVSPAERLREARAAETAHRPSDAAAAYRQLIEDAPTSRLATTARRRLEWLEARSEGGYAPLTTFLAFRDVVPGDRTSERTSAFEEAVAAFPEGRVRRESWALLGETWLTLEEPERAERAFRALLAGPGASETERVMGHTGIARALSARDGAGAGAAHLRDAGLQATPTHDTLARESQRAVGRVVAWCLVALLAASVLATGRRALARGAVLRRALALPRVAVAGVLVAFPVWLAQLYDHDTFDTFAFVGAGSAGVLALGSLGGEALSARDAGLGPRLTVATATVLAELSVGYLALDHADQLISIL